LEGRMSFFLRRPGVFIVSVDEVIQFHAKHIGRSPVAPSSRWPPLCAGRTRSPNAFFGGYFEPDCRRLVYPNDRRLCQLSFAAFPFFSPQQVTIDFGYREPVTIAALSAASFPAAFALSGPFQWFDFGRFPPSSFGWIQLRPNCDTRPPERTSRTGIQDSWNDIFVSRSCRPLVWNEVPRGSGQGGSRNGVGVRSFLHRGDRLFRRLRTRWLKPASVDSVSLFVARPCAAKPSFFHRAVRGCSFSANGPWRR